MTVTPKFQTPMYFAPDDGAGAGGAVEAGAAAAPDAGAVATGEPVATTTGEPVVTPEPDAAAAAAAAAAGTQTAEGDAGASTADPDEGTIPEALKPYVKQLRDEAAERRVALKPYEEAFGVFEPAEAEALLSVVAGLGNEETQFEAATRLKTVVDAILGDGTDDPNRPLTKADLDRIETQKQAKAQEEAAVAAVIKEATDLGYPEGSKTHRRLLDLAVNETAGDLKKAHEALVAEKEAIIAEYAKEVMEGKAKWPTLVAPPGVKPADVSGNPPKTWAEARANSEARRKAAYGQ